MFPCQVTYCTHSTRPVFSDWSACDETSGQHHTYLFYWLYLWSRIDFIALGTIPKALSHSQQIMKGVDAHCYCCTLYAPKMRPMQLIPDPISHSNSRACVTPYQIIPYCSQSICSAHFQCPVQSYQIYRLMHWPLLHFSSRHYWTAMNSLWMMFMEQMLRTLSILGSKHVCSRCLEHAPLLQ